MVSQIQKSVDLAVVWVGGVFHYLLQVVMRDPETILTYVNIGVGVTIIVFTAVRIYYWIKNKGAKKYEDPS